MRNRHRRNCTSSLGLRGSVSATAGSVEGLPWLAESSGGDFGKRPDSKASPRCRQGISQQETSYFCALFKLQTKLLK